MTPELKSQKPADKPASKPANYDRLRQQILSSLERSRAQRNNLRHTDKCFSIASLVLGAIATFVAGQSAIADEPMLGNWRLTTTVASICTLGATVATGIQKQVVPTDLIVESSECTAQLKVLHIETMPEVYDVETVRDSYQRVIAEFSKIDC